MKISLLIIDHDDNCGATNSCDCFIPRHDPHGLRKCLLIVSSGVLFDLIPLSALSPQCTFFYMSERYTSEANCILCSCYSTNPGCHYTVQTVNLEIQVVFQHIHAVTLQICAVILQIHAFILQIHVIVLQIQAVSLQMPTRFNVVCCAFLWSERGITCVLVLLFLLSHKYFHFVNI